MRSPSCGPHPDAPRIDAAFVREWHPRYDFTERDEPQYRRLLEKTRNDAAALGTLTIETFKAILEWKSPRVKGHINWADFPAYADAVRASERAPADAKMQLLVALPGIGAPVASTLLHFLHPSSFPIIDRRTVDVLRHTGYLQHSGTDIQHYPRFRQAILKLRDDLAPVDLREIDRALFAYHKQHPEIFGLLGGRPAPRPWANTTPRGSNRNDPRHTSKTHQRDQNVAPIQTGEDMTTQVSATIRGLGQYDVQGKERFEIHLTKTDAARLLHRTGVPLGIALQVGQEQLRAELRSTEQNKYAWISAKVFDDEGHRTTLVKVLTSNGFRKNQPVALQLTGGVVRVLPQ